MSNKPEEQKLVYGVFVLRTDQNHILAVESENYDECYGVWKKLTEAWTESAQNSIPFQLENPIVTSFSPAMITEIKITVMTTQDIKSKTNNPYYNRMVQNGFANTFASNNSGMGSDILDQGYQRY